MPLLAWLLYSRLRPSDNSARFSFVTVNYYSASNFFYFAVNYMSSSTNKFASEALSIIPCNKNETQRRQRNMCFVWELEGLCACA
jgi:hypothetical protein